MNKEQYAQKLVCIDPFNQEHMDKLMEFESHLPPEQQMFALSKILKEEIANCSQEEYRNKKKNGPREDNFFLEEEGKFKASCYVEEDTKKDVSEVHIFVPEEYRRRYYAKNLLEMIEHYTFFHYPSKVLVASVSLDNFKALNLFQRLSYQLTSSTAVNAIFSKGKENVLSQDGKYRTK